LNQAMRVCLMVEGQEGVEWPQWVALAEAAEAAGLEGLFRSDHYQAIGKGSPAGSLDAWTTLAGLAARTTTLRLGTMVSPVTFRPTSVLAKSVVTVDHISGGRAELGIGAGWFEREHDAYGFPFLTTRARLDELDRQLGEITRQWTEADDIWPKPVQRRLPIIVGGTAKPRTVAAAVRYADEYNTVFPTIEEARERKQVLDAAAREAGREPLVYSMMIGCLVGSDAEDFERRRQRFEREIGGKLPPVHGTVEQVVDQLRSYEAVGVARVMLQHLLHDDLEMVSLLGDVAARLH
jgi:alkanesulfonate monooxygenase SsuD/methylene tetrahydromethanopterin reductase-like flavin-dependent oxidoreductase (luciferase family)